MKNHLSKMFILTVFSSVVLTGCNTVRGIGSDIASVGNGIVNTANKVSYNNQLRKQATTYPNNSYTQPQNYDNYNNQNYNTLPMPTYSQ
ncbi:hypothetical protein [Faucicola boevrei]|uniref:hypothetical protein n=1 Tax=Faucicola boevrei TaxID=346665 RepID=UPI00036F3643|nr:hypothetical protein [Moraxella boevrei]